MLFPILKDGSGLILRGVFPEALGPAEPVAYGATAELVPAAAVYDVTGGGTFYTIKFGPGDRAGEHISANGTTGEITILTDGLYLICFSAFVGGNSFGDDFRIDYLRNGFSRGGILRYINNTPSMALHLSSTDVFTAGDVLTARAYVGGHSNVYDMTSILYGYTEMHIKRVAA